MTDAFLSIIVPTSAGRVPWSLIRSIKEQSLDSNSYEIILVFNGKKKPINTLPMPNAHLFFSPFKGVNHARNLGALHARGAVLLFLDDDCLLQNKNYLQKVVQTHISNPEQMSIGGPYALNPDATTAGLAYHLNRSNWLRSQHVDDDHTVALLGGNASYKRHVFLKGLRFSPGIRYGGSETPFNLSVAQQFGPHMFLRGLELEHTSHLSLFSFVKKAYLQGKGAAFQEKFHSTNSRRKKYQAETATGNNISLLLLLWLYDFCFMVGYRTSIHERHFALKSLCEECFRRSTLPLMGLFYDFRAALTVSNDERSYPLRPHVIPQTTAPISLESGDSLFRKLQTLSKNDFEHRDFLWNDSSPHHCDRLFEDMNTVENFFGQPPESLRFVPSRKMIALRTQTSADQRVIVFDPALSDNCKTWGKDRIESSKIKNSIFYFFSDPANSQNVSVLNALWPHKMNRTFYFLDAVSVEKNIWAEYLASTPDPFNHFSWNAFIHARQMNPQYDTTKIGAAYRPTLLMEHAQAHFVNFPSRSFYQDNLVLLGSNWRRRSVFLKILLTFKSIAAFFPKKVFASLKNNVARFKDRCGHWYVETQESSHLIFKWTTYALHKIYWLSNALFWKTYSFSTFVTAQLIWRSFDAVIFVYLNLNRSYWKLHELLIGPFLGFIASLAKEPQHFKDLPLQEKWKQRSLLFLKKWAWLALRTAGLK